MNFSLPISSRIMISTIAVIVFMVIVMFSLNIWLALACILPIIVGVCCAVLLYVRL